MADGGALLGLVAGLPKKAVLLSPAMGLVASLLALHPLTSMEFVHVICCFANAVVVIMSVSFPSKSASANVFKFSTIFASLLIVLLTYSRHWQFLVGSLACSFTYTIVFGFEQAEVTYTIEKNARDFSLSLELAEAACKKNFGVFPENEMQCLWQEFLYHRKWKPDTEWAKKLAWHQKVKAWLN